MWERESLAAFKLALDVVNAKGITSKNLDRVDMLTLRDKSCHLSKVTGDSSRLAICRRRQILNLSRVDMRSHATAKFGVHRGG